MTNYRLRALYTFVLVVFITLLALQFGCASNTAELSAASPASTDAGAVSASVAEPTPEPSHVIVFSSGSVDEGVEELTVCLTEEDIPLLDSLPGLKVLHAEGSSCTEAILSYKESHPGVSVYYTVPFGDTFVQPDISEAEITNAYCNADTLKNSVPYLPNLTKITVSGGSLEPDVASELINLYPSLEWAYSVRFNGLDLPNTAEGLDLCNVPVSSRDTVCSVLSALPGLRIVCLNPESHLAGTDAEIAEEEPAEEEVISARVTEALLANDTYNPITWKPEGSDTSNASAWTLEDVAALQQAKPGLVVDYPMEAFGVSFSIATEVLTLSEIPMSGYVDTLYELAPYLTNCSLIEMEDCGIGNEDMAVIRDKVAELQPYASPNVVWRIKCGAYTTRTDAIMIKFSGKSPAMTDGKADALKYCNKVRYLDLGHNHLTRMDYVSYMPDLEVAILAVGYYKDCSPLANCPKLEYLELESGILHDISCLSGLTNLRHLNIAYNVLTDLSPLYNLTGLERCWISRNDFPEEQIEKLQQLLPNCTINTTAHDPTSQGWRKTNGVLDERYALLKEQFVYANSHIRSYYIKQGKVIPLYT